VKPPQLLDVREVRQNERARHPEGCGARSAVLVHILNDPVDGFHDALLQAVADRGRSGVAVGRVGDIDAERAQRGDDAPRDRWRLALRCHSPGAQCNRVAERLQNCVCRRNVRCGYEHDVLVRVVDQAERPRMSRSAERSVEDGHEPPRGEAVVHVHTRCGCDGALA
jgi:hypothetical protein